MLLDNPTLDDRSDEPVGANETYTVKISTPNPVRDGVIDVVSFRSLVRACKVAMGYETQDDFERALAKMMNVSGAMAQALEIERHRRR